MEKAQKKQPKGKCPKERKGVEFAHNDPGWYLRDGTPRFSGEFDDLQKIGVINKVLPNGIQLDTAANHACVIAPPIDAENSFYKQCATLLSKIRKKNTGTGIYTTEQVLVYIWKVLLAHTYAAQLAKEIKAVSYIMPGNADSPWAALNIVNPDRDWESEASQLADTKNKADIVFKMLDALPIPEFTALDRNKFLFSGVFADSKGGKPSFSVFRPNYLTDLAISSNVITKVLRNGAGDNTTISGSLDVITAILADIYDDTGGNFTMLRGDIMKYWKPKPRALALLASPLEVKATTPELASQLENMGILARVSGFSGSDFDVTVSASGTTLHFPLAGILNPDIDSKAELQEMPINSRGGVPADGELMAITALMPIAEQVNGVTSSYWNVLAHNGVVVFDTFMLLSTARNLSPGPSIRGIGQAIADSHSSNQSTMKSAFVFLQWASSIVAHSPLYITDDTDPTAFIWDVDYVGVISSQALSTAITRVVRSLYQVNLPEREY